MIDRKDKSKKFAHIAMSQQRKLKELIYTLNNTTIGDLRLRVINNEDDIITLDNRIDTLDNKITAIASIFDIVFNADGTLNSESYTTHKHNYIDTTITDTDDGSGIENSATKATDGVTT